jgi:hypothetical protein
MDRHILASHADVAATNSSVSNQPAGHEFRGVTPDRKADSLRRPNHCRIHANDFAG